jgi:hypothetical protein
LANAALTSKLIKCKEEEGEGEERRGEGEEDLG